MAKTKRTRNIARNTKAELLKEEIKRDPNRVLAYIPVTFVSRKCAFRSYKLTEDDLSNLNHVAVIGEKKGHDGIFYPLGDIRALAKNKEDWSMIDESMIPESMIRKQIPKNHFDTDYLKRFREFGVYGTRNGHKGKNTFFYTEDDIERELDLKVITCKMVEGKDYIKERSVPDDVLPALDPPYMCLWSDGSNGMIEPCFLGLDVEAILSNHKMEDVRRKSKRIMQQKPVLPTPPCPEQVSSSPASLGQLSATPEQVSPTTGQVIGSDQLPSNSEQPGPSKEQDQSIWDESFEFFN